MSVMKKIKFVLVMFIPLIALVGIIYMIQYAIELRKGEIPPDIKKDLITPYLDAVKAGKAYDAYYTYTTDNYKATFNFDLYEGNVKLKWNPSIVVELDRIELFEKNTPKMIRIYFKRTDAKGLTKEAAIYDVIQVEDKWKIDKSYTQDFNRLAPQPM